MEDKMAWRRVHTELVENHRLTQEMNASMANARACRSELLSSLTTDGNGSFYTPVEDKTKADTGVNGELNAGSHLFTFCRLKKKK